MLMLFGRPVSEIFFVICRVFGSTTARTRSASLVKYSREPSGAAAAPWLIGTPWISPTMALVAGSMRWMLSSPELVWTMRTWRDWAAASEAAMSRTTGTSVKRQARIMSASSTRRRILLLRPGRARQGPSYYNAGHVFDAAAPAFLAALDRPAH